MSDVIIRMLMTIGQNKAREGQHLFFIETTNNVIKLQTEYKKITNVRIRWNDNDKNQGLDNNKYSSDKNLNKLFPYTFF
jgi:hypothetical protein